MPLVVVWPAPDADMPRRFYPACCGVGSVLFLWGGAGWAVVCVWSCFSDCAVLAFRTSPRRVEGAGFEPAKAWPSDLQSDPFDRLGIPPKRGKSQIIAQNAPLCQVISPIFKIFFHPLPQNNKSPPSTPAKPEHSTQNHKKPHPPPIAPVAPPAGAVEWSPLFIVIPEFSFRPPLTPALSN